MGNEHDELFRKGAGFGLQGEFTLDGKSNVEPTEYGLRLVMYDSYAGPIVIKKVFFEPGDVKMSRKKYFLLRDDEGFCSRLSMICRYKAGRMLRFPTEEEARVYLRDELELKAWVWILQIGDLDKSGKDAGPGYYITSVRNRLRNAHRDAGRKRWRKYRFTEYIPPEPKKRPRGRPRKKPPDERETPFPKRIDPYADTWDDQPVKIIRKSLETVSGSIGRNMGDHVKVVNDPGGTLETDKEFEDRMRKIGKSGKVVSGNSEDENVKDALNELEGADDQDGVDGENEGQNDD